MKHEFFIIILHYILYDNYIIITISLFLLMSINILGITFASVVAPHELKS